MTVGIRATSTASTVATSFSLSVPLPSGTAQGDFVIVSLALGNSSMSGVVASSGWTKVGEIGGSGLNRLAVFWRIMPASPPSSVTLDWTAGGIAGGALATAVAYTGVNNASVIDGGGTAYDNSGTTASLTTGHASSRLILCTSNNAVATTPTSYTKEIENASGSTSSAIFDLTAGAAGAYSVTTTTNESIFLALNAQAPPLAPTLTTPINASYQDLATGITFGWTYNPATSGVTQTAYALRRKIGAGAYEWWNAGTLAWQGTEIFNTSSAGSIAFAASKWANGTTYNWSVNTQDSNGTGTYSADNTVTGSVAPTATVTGPTGTVAGASPSVSWTETLQSGASQTAYRVVIESGAYSTTPGSGTTVWDSGIVGSAALTVIAGTALANGASYRVFVQVTETGGQVSPWAFSTFTVTYDTPATPSLIAIWDSTIARCVIAAQGRDNLLSLNASSIETDATAWVAAGNCAVARSTAQAIDGTASLSMSSTAAGDMSARTVLNAVPVTPGKVYTFVASFRAATVARAVHVEAYWMASDGTTIISVPAGAATADNTAGFTQATLTAQAPSNAAFAVVQPVVSTTGAAAEVHYVDRIGLFPDPTGNLVDVSDFENDLGSWAASTNCAVVQSTAQAYTGRASLQVKSMAAGDMYPATTSYGVAGGQTYTASLYVRAATTARNVQMVANFYDASHVFISQISGTTVADTSTGWTRVSATGTAPSNAAYIGLFPAVRATGAANEVHYYDAVQVVVGSTATTYVPPTYSNLITNPSFEVDTAGWSVGSRIVVTRDTTRYYVGAASGKLTLTAGAADATVTAIPVQAGVATTFQYRAYVPASWPGGPGDLYADIIGPDAFDSANIGPDLTKRDQWQLVTGTVTPTASGMANLRFVTSGTYAGTVWVDAIQVEYGNVANTYIDGAQGPGYSWDASQNLLSAAAASFEDGTTGGWSVAGSASVANSATRAVSGTKSLAITLTTQSIAFSTGSFLANTLAPKTTYTASAYVYNPTTGGASGGVAVRVDNGAGPVYVSTTTTTRDAWVRVVLTFTTDSTGQANFFVANAGASTAGNVVYLDAVQYEQRSYATPYNQTATANVATSTYQQPWTIGGFASSGSYIVEASEDGGITWKTVRGASALTVDSAANQQFTVYDYERTPGATVLYRARVSDVSVTSLNSPTSSCVVSITSWWVKDVTNPALNKSICDAQQHVRNRKGDSAAVYPAGRTNPVVLRGPVHGADGQMRTVVSTEADRTAILSLFTAQASMLLQDPRGRQWYVEWTGDLTETQMQTDSTHPIYAIQRNWVEVDVPS